MGRGIRGLTDLAAHNETNDVICNNLLSPPLKAQPARRALRRLRSYAHGKEALLAVPNKGELEDVNGGYKGGMPARSYLATSTYYRYTSLDMSSESSYSVVSLSDIDADFVKGSLSVSLGTDLDREFHSQLSPLLADDWSRWQTAPGVESRS